MGVFGIVLLVLFSIVCALLVFMVVIQDQEGEGLGGLFSGAGNAAFGSRSSNVIVRFTYVLGALFFIIAFTLAIMQPKSSNDKGVLQAAEATQGSGLYRQDQPETPVADGAVPEATTPETPPVKP
jgi:preprotein translocase subunit SecG